MVNQDYLNNPFYLYAMMDKHPHGEHLFRQAVGYNPFFISDIDYGYNTAGTLRYLANPYASYDYSMSALALRRLGAPRKLGMNNVYEQIAAAQAYQFSGMSLGIGAVSALGQIGTFVMNPIAGLAASLGLGSASDAFRENMQKLYAQNQKINVLTQNMLGEYGVGTGLSAKEIKGIAKSIRKMGVEDELLSADDIQDMVLRLSRYGFMNDVNSATQFKQVVRALKDRVKGLAEFMGETDPTKLLQDLAKYKSLGFTRAQSFDVMKSLKIASDLSGINMETIQSMVGMSTHMENPLAIDRRVRTRQMIAQLNQMNFLSRSPLRSNYLTNRQELFSAYTSAAEKADVALERTFGINTNKDIFLAMQYGKERGIGLREAYAHIERMGFDEKRRLANEYAKKYEDFGRIYYNKNLLATVVQENPEVGALNIKRTPIEKLVENIVRQLEKGGRQPNMEEVMFYLERQAGLSAKELSAIKPIVEGRLKFGNFGFLDVQSEAAEERKRLMESANELIRLKEREGPIYKLGRMWRGITNTATEIFGGFLGEDIFENVKAMEESLKPKSMYNREYATFVDAERFRKATESRSFHEYIRNLQAFAEPGKQSEDLRKGLERATEMAHKSVFKNVMSEANVEFMYKRSYLEEKAPTNIAYWRELFKAEAERTRKQAEASYVDRAKMAMLPMPFMAGFEAVGLVESSMEYARGPMQFEERARYLQDKRLERFVKGRGLHGRYEVEALVAAQKELGIAPGEQLTEESLAKLAPIMRGAEAYYRYQKAGAKGAFADYLKQRGESEEFAQYEQLYKQSYAYVDKDTQRRRLIEAAIAGDIGRFKKLLKVSPALGSEDLEEIRSKVGFAGDEFRKAIEEYRLSQFGNVKATEEGRKGVEAGAKLYAELAKIAPKERAKIEEALQSGDRSALAQAIEGVSDKTMRRRILDTATQFISAVGDTDKWGEYYEYGKRDFRQLTRKNISNLFASLGLQGTDRETQMRILETWSKHGDRSALELINKERSRLGESAITMRDLRRIERLTSEAKELGFGKEKEQKMLGKIATMSESEKSAVQVMLERQSLDVLRRIADNTDPAKLGKVLASYT